MLSIVRISIFSLFLLGVVFGQYDVKLEKKSNYNNWGTSWDSIYVVKNDLITLAVMPKIGGRIMQYDLGNHPSIYIHDDSKGQVPDDGNMMIGGFRVLPSPQSDFVWPSPPKLDCKPYSCTIRHTSFDSTVIYLESQVEDSNEEKYKKHKGMQFKRLITLYKASTRVKVEMTMLNKGTSSMKHGIWDITQSTCTNSSSADKGNFWVYFQRNPSSTLGGGKGYVQYMHEGTDDSQWKPDAAPDGIMGVQYLQETGKIGADCSAGWIAFVDQLDGYAYVKTFTYEEGKEYPDSGVSVQVYTYNYPDMLEVEVLGPLTTLKAGDSTRLVENWFAARAFGPVLAVNSAGLITKRLEAKQTGDSISLKGTYGLFYPGKIRSTFVNNSGAAVSVADSFTVTPVDSLGFTKKYRVPAGATALHLLAHDNTGKLLGTLDTVLVPEPVGISGRPESYPAADVKRVTLTRKNGYLNVDVHSKGPFTVDLFTIEGKLIAKYKHASSSGSFLLPVNAVNVFMVRASGSGWRESMIVCSAGYR